MKTYKNKYAYVNYIALLFAFAVLSVPMLYFKALFKFQSDIIDNLMLFCVDTVIVLVVTCIVPFLLLNAIPVSIGDNGEFFRIRFFCGNEINVTHKEIRVLKKNDYGFEWIAILFVKGRFVSVNSSFFPNLKKIIKS